MNETLEWCNIFLLLPKLNGKVRVCQDPARLNTALLKPVHRGPTLNDILPRPAVVKYLTLIDVNSGCHLKLDERLPYLTTCSFSFGKYRYISLPIGAALVGDMFQKKMDELLSGMLKVCGIADDILIAGFDVKGKAHDITLEKVLLGMEAGESKA